MQTPALEAGMILAGISLRSAPLNLWVLIEPRVESDFASAAAARRDIFSQTVALLLKFTKTSHQIYFSDSEVFNTRVIHIHRRTSDRTKPQPETVDAASPLFSPYFAREGGVRNVGGGGVKVSIPARPERSRGRPVREHGWRCGCCGGGNAGA